MTKGARSEVMSTATGILILSGLIALSSCRPGRVEFRPGRAVAALPGASLVASSNDSYRLIISRKLRDAPSRLWAVHARIETFGNTPLRIDPEGARLILADGTHTHPLDPPRVEALLKRTEIGAGNLAYLDTRHPPTGLSGGAKRRIRNEILARPFLTGEVTRSHPVEGFMIVDTKQEVSSLEGAVLEVEATRLDDGAFVRRLYRFPAPDQEHSTTGQAARLNVRHGIATDSRE